MGRSVGAGGNGIGGAVQEAFAEAASAIVGARHLRNLKELLMQFAEMDFNRFFFFGASDAEAQDVARFLLGGPPFGTAWNFPVVPAKNFITDLQAAFCRGAVDVDGSESPGLARFALGQKPERGADGFVVAQFKTGARE